MVLSLDPSYYGALASGTDFQPGSSNLQRRTRGYLIWQQTRTSTVTKYSTRTGTKFAWLLSFLVHSPTMSRYNSNMYPFRRMKRQTFQNSKLCPIHGEILPERTRSSSGQTFFRPALLMLAGFWSRTVWQQPCHIFVTGRWSVPYRLTRFASTKRITKSGAPKSRKTANIYSQAKKVVSWLGPGEATSR